MTFPLLDDDDQLEWFERDGHECRYHRGGLCRLSEMPDQSLSHGARREVRQILFSPTCADAFRPRTKSRQAKVSEPDRPVPCRSISCGWQAIPPATRPPCSWTVRPRHTLATSSASARVDRRAKRSEPRCDLVPILYSAWDKSDQSDDLLVCFGALAIGQATGTEIPPSGKVIYGEGHRSKTVRIADHLPKTRQVIEAIASICHATEPPPLVLNKHCPTCDFQLRCRALAVERDDLSLLGAMTAKERANARRRAFRP